MEMEVKKGIGISVFKSKWAFKKQLKKVLKSVNRSFDLRIF